MSDQNSPAVRQPAVSGTFYSGDTETLRQDIGRMLAENSPPEVPGDLIALVVPHAGIDYSGSVAAHAYGLLERDQFPRTILVGASHRHPVRSVAICREGSWTIPGAEFSIDQEFVESFESRIAFDLEGPAAHVTEHSLEVQLPFLAETLGAGPIAPMLLGRARPVICEEVGTALAETIRDDRPGLLLASTDLSHFYNEDRAKRLDTVAVKAILSLSADQLYRRSRAGETELCGQAAVLTVMYAAKKLGANRATLLAYATSGDVTHDWKEVVGYTAIAISRKE